MKDRLSSVIQTAILDGIVNVRTENGETPDLPQPHQVDMEPFQTAAALGLLAD